MYSHITIATVGRQRMFGKDQILSAVRAIARVGGNRLLLFCVVDDHGHFIVTAEVGDAGRFASGLSRALTAAGAAPLQRAHVRPVGDRRHLETLVAYLVRQPSHHGLRGGEALWVGSCAQDLLGVRRLAGFEPSRIADLLPRLDVPAVVARTLDVRIRPASDHDLRTLGSVRLWQAACAAFGVSEDDRSRSDAALLARATFADLVRTCGLSAVEARHAAGVAERAWYRLHPDPDAVAVVRRRVGLAAASHDVAGV